MTLSPHDIQKPRSPKDLLAFVEAVRQVAATDTELAEAGHLRSGYLKEFFDEIVPLAKAASKIYPEDHTVCPILGNQGYDAEVRDSLGALVDRVEIANVVDGRSVAEMRRELAESSISTFRVETPGDDLEDLMGILERTVAKKAVKDYSDSTVVFNVSAYPAFSGFEKQHAEQVARIKRILSGVAFRAKRVYVVLPSGDVERVDE